LPEWLLTIIIGGVIVGLIGVIYGMVTSRISGLEEWKGGRPSHDELMTISKHYEFCANNTKELKRFIKEEMEDVKKEIRTNGKR